MGLPSMGGGRPPLPNQGAPAPRGPGGPPMAGGAPGGPAGGTPRGDIRQELMQLQQSLPPEFQSMLDPQNPITALQYQRLRDLSDEEGQALLMLFGNAPNEALHAAQKVWPELMLLLDIFDDGEVNDSVGDGGMGAEPGGPPMGGPPVAGRPPSPAPGPADMDDDDEDAPPRGRLSSIMG